MAPDTVNPAITTSLGKRLNPKKRLAPKKMKKIWTINGVPRTNNTYAAESTRTAGAATTRPGPRRGRA